MTDFALYHCGQWRDGQGPNFTTTIYTVRQDATTRAYAVPYADFDSFQSWVAVTFAGNNDWQEDGEPDADFLERIGVRINKVFPA